MKFTEGCLYGSSQNLNIIAHLLKNKWISIKTNYFLKITYLIAITKYRLSSHKVSIWKIVKMQQARLVIKKAMQSRPKTIGGNISQRAWCVKFSAMCNVLPHPLSILSFWVTCELRAPRECPENSMYVQQDGPSPALLKDGCHQALLKAFGASFRQGQLVSIQDLWQARIWWFFFVLNKWGSALCLSV